MRAVEVQGGIHMAKSGHNTAAGITRDEMTEPRPVYNVPWTRRQFQRELRQAGWQRMSGPAAVYVSPDGRRFHLDDCIAEVGVLWRFYAARRKLPQG